MVYVIDGIVYAGHKPQGDEYRREPTKFALPDDNVLNLLETKLHLYVCAACPWAHRALIIRNLSKTLRANVTVSVVSPYRDDDKGWEFLCDENRERLSGFDKLPVTTDSSPLGASTLLEIYLAASPNYTGNITTPTLYDAKSNRILSNDSFGIMRAFVKAVPEEIGCFYPMEHRIDIDAVGRKLDAELGQRVYMCGLAKTQGAYEDALNRVDAELERLETILGDKDRRYLVGDALSLADIQLLVVLVRFDPVYFVLFKCFRRRIVSFPALSAYARIVAEEIGSSALSLDLDQIVHHYFTNFTSANPNGLVPIAYRKTDFLDGGIDEHREDTAIASSVMLPKGGGTEQDQTNKKERLARGEFVRGVSAQRNWLGGDEFPVEANRYVLFVANNCPWCHRTLLARAMYPGMKDLVNVSVLFYRRGGGGPNNGYWCFLPSDPNELREFERIRPDLLEGIDTADPTGNNIQYAPDIYKLTEPESNQKSVPILFDTQTKRVVSNESADIVRMFSIISDSFDETLLERTDAINARIYQDVNNGAYRAGFTSNQASHDEAAHKYFVALNWLNTLLQDSTFVLTEDAPTEVDLRLFPTIFRHDPVYYARMKLNVAMVRDYPHLNRWFRDMISFPEVRSASRLDHCVAGYFGRTGNNLCPFVGLEHDGVRPY